jgi:hypothetical protein
MSHLHRKHTNLTNEIMTERPKDHSNLCIGIALGVIVTLCAGIYLFGTVAEKLMY